MEEKNKYMKSRKKIMRQLERKKNYVNKLNNKRLSKSGKSELQNLITHIDSQISLLDILDAEFDVSCNDTDNIWNDIMNIETEK